MTGVNKKADTIAEARLARLEMLLKRFPKTAAFTQTVGVSRSYISLIRNKRRNMGIVVARQIETKLNLPAGWMDTPLGSQDLPSGSATPNLDAFTPRKDPDRRADIKIGFWRQGCSNERYVAIHLPTSFLADSCLSECRPLCSKKQTDESFFMFPVLGDEMLPMLAAGDIVVATNCMPAGPSIMGGIFVISSKLRPDEPLIRRLISNMDGTIGVHCENAVYVGPEIIEKDAINILGKVVSVIKRV